MITTLKTYQRKHPNEPGAGPKWAWVHMNGPNGPGPNESPKGSPTGRYWYLFMSISSYWSLCLDVYNSADYGIGMRDIRDIILQARPARLVFKWLGSAGSARLVFKWLGSSGSARLVFKWPGWLCSARPAGLGLYWNGSARLARLSSVQYLCFIIVIFLLFLLFLFFLLFLLFLL